MKILLAVLPIIVVAVACGSVVHAAEGVQARVISREVRASGLQLVYLVEAAAPPEVDRSQATLVAQTTVADDAGGYRSTIAVRVSCGGALVVVVEGVRVEVERRWCALLPEVVR